MLLSHGDTQPNHPCLLCSKILITVHRYIPLHSFLNPADLRNNKQKE
jgi:hypothetical protein